MKCILLLIISLLIQNSLEAKNAGQKELISNHLYIDLILARAADPLIIWTQKLKRWWMLYNRHCGIC